MLTVLLGTVSGGNDRIFFYHSKIIRLNDFSGTRIEFLLLFAMNVYISFHIRRDMFKVYSLKVITATLITFNRNILLLSNVQSFPRSFFHSNTFYFSERDIQKSPVFSSSPCESDVHSSKSNSATFVHLRLTSSTAASVCIFHRIYYRYFSEIKKCAQ